MLGGGPKIRIGIDLASIWHRSGIDPASIWHRSGIDPASVRHRSGIGPASVRHRSGIDLLDQSGIIQGASGSIRDASRSIRESKNHQKIKKSPFSKKFSVPCFSRRDKSSGNIPADRKCEEIRPKMPNIPIPAPSPLPLRLIFP